MVLYKRHFFFLLIFLAIIDCLQGQSLKDKDLPIQLQHITSLPASQNVFFGRIYDMDIMRGKTILVLDGRQKKLYAFDLTGLLNKTIAAKGRGPGEIAGAYSNALEVGPKGHIALYDQMNNKIIFWDEHGKYIRDYPMPGGWGTSIQWNNTGTIMLKRNRFRPDENGNKPIEFSKVDQNNGAITPLGTIPLTDKFDAKYTCVFCPWVLTDENTIVTGRNNTDYAFYEITLKGKLLRRWSRSGLAPVRYSKNELKKIKVKRHDSPVPYPSNDPLPVFKNRFKHFQIDKNGRVWAQINVAEKKGSAFDVYTREGAFIQRVLLDKKIEMLKIRGDYLLGRLDTDSEEPEGFVYKIRG